MELKVYVVIEVPRPGSERVIAVRLTNSSARKIAGQAPNRAVKLFLASKEEDLTNKEITSASTQEEADGNSRYYPGSSS